MIGDFAVGFSGFAKSGKSAAASYLERAYGFKRQHIAEPMRAMLAVLMRANNISPEMIDRYLVGDLKDGYPIQELGGKTSRELQISIGTAWGRRCVHPDLWTGTWIRQAHGEGRVMNDSVRFSNEEAAIRDLGGITIMIRRPGTGPIAYKWGRIGRWLHEKFAYMGGVDDSERTDLLDPDVIIDNVGSLADLYHDLDSVMQDYGILPVKASVTESAC